MLKIALLLVLALPGLAGAEMWRWKDTAGQVHYSNVPGHVPAHAATVHRDVGYLATAPLAPEVTPSADLERLHEERAIKRRLADIEAFYAAVRARQRARLEAYANSTLLPDWNVADRWLRLKDEEGRLRADLARLARRDPERAPYIQAPPSTRRTLPVIQAASSEARKTAARPMSAGSPARPSGMVCKTASPWKRIRRSPISERTRPGAMTFTRTPALATSLASTLASAFTPALAT